ncbi:thioesterase family protein [Thalassobaculum sp.]|uniref:acyl-CoA thioesterase n=1 Tax=Thalassobaculum sp. TaxID=2022740 RepID=UPI0032EE415F
MHDADLDALRDSRADRYRTTVAVRYADLDTNGHVNHAAYLAYLEEARLGFRASMADLTGDPDDLSWPIAEVTVRYVRSLMYPQDVTVEVAPLRVGRTSFTLGYGLFAGAGCAAVALTRSVCVSRGRGGPVPLPAALADRLRALLPA